MEELTKAERLRVIYVKMRDEGLSYAQARRVVDFWAELQAIHLIHDVRLLPEYLTHPEPLVRKAAAARLRHLQLWRLNLLCGACIG